MVKNAAEGGFILPNLQHKINLCNKRIALETKQYQVKESWRAVSHQEIEYCKSAMCCFKAFCSQSCSKVEKRNTNDLAQTDKRTFHSLP